MLTTKCIHINHINCSSLALESKLASTAQLSAVAMHSTPTLTQQTEAQTVQLLHWFCTLGRHRVLTEHFSEGPPHQ